MNKKHSSFCVCKICKKKNETYCRGCGKAFIRHSNGRMIPCESCFGKYIQEKNSRKKK